jgi:hypothetical protein
MSTKVHCYLRTLRRRCGLTQEEVASLLPEGDRNRVSSVEWGEAPPNAAEIVAYGLIFDSSCRALFPGFHEEIEDAVMRRAYQLYKDLKEGHSGRAAQLCSFIEEMFARTTNKSSFTKL